MRLSTFHTALAAGVVCLVLAGCQRPDTGGPGGQVAAEHSDLYGETGGEAVLPATSASGGLLRARKGDTFFRLSNPRVEPPRQTPFPTLVIDYEKVTEGPYNGVTLVIHHADGAVMRYILVGPLAEQRGTIEISFQIGPPGTPGAPRNAELYLTRGEHRYGGGFNPTFKVSNSVAIGQPRGTTLAREWTAEEAAKLRQPPPEGVKPNVNPTVGVDTQFVGDTTGGGSFRYAEPGKPVIGVEYWMGSWDGEPSLARLIPVYDLKQPVEGAAKRVMGKPGYAISALTVRSKRYVNAVQITFAKLSPDGKFDPSSSSTSEWLGDTQVAGKEPGTLGGDGRRVIGIHCKQGAILNGIALVMESAPGK